jgi:hypothetical protein
MLPSPPIKKKLSRASMMAQKMAKSPAEGRQSVQLQTRCTSGSATPSAEFRAAARGDAAAFAAQKHRPLPRLTQPVLRHPFCMRQLQRAASSGAAPLCWQHFKF